MSINVTQTSAARIVRASRVSEADCQRLVADFGIHPLDAERLLTVPDRSGVERYHDYVLVNLLCPWPTAHGMVSLDIRLVVSQKYLFILGDVPGKMVERWVEAINPTSSDSPAGQAVAFLLSLSQAMARATRSQAGQPAVHHEIDGCRLAFEQFSRALEQTGMWLTSDQRQQLALARHHLHTPDTVSVAPIAPRPVPINQQTVAGYVAVTAAVLLVSLLFRP